jgi:hypothetical protein
LNGSEMQRFPQRRLAAAVAMAAIMAGCGGESGGGQKTESAEPPKRTELAVSRPTDGKRTRRSSVVVAGTVTSGSDVRVNGKQADVVGDHFRARLRLHVGENAIDITANQEGLESASRTIYVTRRRRPRPRPIATASPEPTREATPEPTEEPEQSADCDPNYEGACLDPSSSDYDCEGGSGDGPDYTGPVRVVGDDPFDLDRDGDGYACE